ncbi:MAG TPA: right-handed parallel beta-helix repeat-containing protein [Solirubrobacterales bacterium]|jgi:hypothetical protein|nr:right-handed parallel beta-helix repeat-containing protein [Solirubrobacterales bacterium]
MRRSILVGALLAMMLSALGVGWAVAQPGGGGEGPASATSHHTAGGALGNRQPLLRIRGGRPSRDATAPNTLITKEPAASGSVSTASFSFSSSESKSTFACKLDGGRWGRCSSPKSYSKIALGAHQFSVRATDAAGNTDATPAADSWAVTGIASAPVETDTTAPETTISSGPEASTTATDASFAFASSESGSTFACQLDGGGWAPCSSPDSYSALTLGTHQFSVRATDAAGNADATPASQSWTVEAPPPPPDTTAPETTISSGPQSSTTATAASFAFSSSESGSTFACKLDSGSWSSCVSPTSYAALTLGTHQFSVRATDVAGNADATPASQTWTVQEAAQGGACSQTVSSIAAAQSALGSAAVGSVVCLADGSYGSLSLSMKRPAPGVTLRAQNPGQASVGSVSVSGGGVAVERLVTGSLNVSASADGVAFRHNSTTGGVYVIGTTSSYAKNIEISGNLIKPSSGSGEKDTFMLQRFEALRIENNQIWIADEDGNHNDGLQTVWGGRGLIFRGNWMRGGAGSQGFFIKDGEVTNVTFEDNLIAGRPSKAPYAGAPLQVFDTVPNAADPFYTGYGLLIRHNTIWSNPNTSYVRECQNKAIMVELNVMDGWGAPDGTSCVLSQLTQDYNVITGGTIGKRGAHDTSTAPSFVDSANQDWQLTSGSAGNFSGARAGITWQPAAQAYGP